MEHVLLLSFLLVGIYMFLGASEFSPAAARFPRLMAGATVILSTLLLLRNRLRYVFPPLLALAGAYVVYIGATEFAWSFWPVVQVTVGTAFVLLAVARHRQVSTVAETLIAEPMQVLGESDLDVAEADAQEGEAAETDSSSGALYVYEIDDPRGPVVTGVLCVGYMVLTFAIGMLYSTPLFVIAYTFWSRMARPRMIALTIISFVTAYLFYWLISDDIAVGWYTGWEPLPPPTPPELLDQLLTLQPGLVESAVVVADLGVVVADLGIVVTDRGAVVADLGVIVA